MDKELQAFLSRASPHAWKQVSHELHQQACIVRSNRLPADDLIEKIRGERLTRSTTNRTCFLLGAFALENAIKAFLVFQNPNWISNGKLSKSLKSHKLTSLESKVTDIPRTDKMDWVLSSFESGIESWARYPCGLNKEQTSHEEIMDDLLWDKYFSLITLYHNELRNLLNDKTWIGPHGFSISAIEIKHNV